MNDNFIRIRITKGGANQEAPQNQAPQAPQTPETQTPSANKDMSFTPKSKGPNDGVINNLKPSAINTALIHIGKTAVGYALSNYESITGDSIGQQSLNDALNLGGLMATFAFGGPAGIIAGTTQIATAALNRYVEVTKSRNVSKNMQARLGISIGGSR